MREYKFKAYYKPLKRMLEPEQIESINLETKVLGVYMEMDGKGYHKLRMSDFILLQYTGLNDKSCKEIYEGDVLQFEDVGEEGYEYREGYDFTNRAAVIFENGRFTLDKFMDLNSAVVEEINRHEEVYNTMKFSLVIGSIHDNPELLEETV